MQLNSVLTRCGLAPLPVEEAQSGKQCKRHKRGKQAALLSLCQLLLGLFNQLWSLCSIVVESRFLLFVVVVFSFVLSLLLSLVLSTSVCPFPIHLISFCFPVTPGRNHL